MKLVATASMPLKEDEVGDWLKGGRDSASKGGGSMWKKSAAAVVASLFIACADPTTVGVEGMYACFSPTGLVVENTSSAEIYYAAFDRAATASINWAPCTDPATCPRIGAGSSETIPFNKIAFWEAFSREAVLYWWRLEPTFEGGFRPDSIRALVVAK